jgi:hypothetical protein
MKADCLITSGCPYVVVIAVKYKVSPVLFSIRASALNMVKIEGRREAGRAFSRVLAPQQINGEEITANKRSIIRIFLESFTG